MHITVPVFRSIIEGRTTRTRSTGARRLSSKSLHQSSDVERWNGANAPLPEPQTLVKDLEEPAFATSISIGPR